MIAVSLLKMLKSSWGGGGAGLVKVEGENGVFRGDFWLVVGLERKM